MNIKILLKTLLLIVVLALLVFMGMYNTQDVELKLPHILPTAQKLPAALMYFGFFAVGLLVGTVLMAGGKKGGSSGGKNRVEK